MEGHTPLLYHNSTLSTRMSGLTGRIHTVLTFTAAVIDAQSSPALSDIESKTSSQKMDWQNARPGKLREIGANQPKYAPFPSELPLMMPRQAESSP